MCVISSFLFRGCCCYFHHHFFMFIRNCACGTFMCWCNAVYLLHFRFRRSFFFHLIVFSLPISFSLSLSLSFFLFCFNSIRIYLAAVFSYCIETLASPIYLCNLTSYYSSSSIGVFAFLHSFPFFRFSVITVFIEVSKNHVPLNHYFDCNSQQLYFPFDYVNVFTHRSHQFDFNWMGSFFFWLSDLSREGFWSEKNSFR